LHRSFLKARRREKRKSFRISLPVLAKPFVRAEGRWSCVIACTFLRHNTRLEYTREWYSLEKLDLPLSWRLRFYFVSCDKNSTTIDTLMYHSLHLEYDVKSTSYILVVTSRSLISEQLDLFHPLELLHLIENVLSCYEKKIITIHFYIISLHFLLLCYFLLLYYIIRKVLYTSHISLLLLLKYINNIFTIITQQF